MKNFHREGGAGGWKGPKKFGERGSWDRGSGGRDSARPTMHKATCSQCGNACEVPFKPNGSRPIFCRDCFKKDGNAEPRRLGATDVRRPSFDEKKMFQAVCDKCGNACEVPFRPTGEKPVYCRPCFGKGNAPAPEHRNNAADHKSIEQFAEQFRTLNVKLDAILKALAPAAPAVAMKEEGAAKGKETPKKVEKKKSAAKKKK